MVSMTPEAYNKYPRGFHLERSTMPYNIHFLPEAQIEGLSHRPRDDASKRAPPFLSDA